MVHLFEKLGGSFLLDSESGSLYRPDRCAYLAAKARWDVLDDAQKSEYGAFSNADREEAASELDALVLQGTLDLPPQKTPAPAKSAVIKAMCLNICHDCNLRCKYCFADEGKYNGERGRMSAETARAAVDFLIRSSGARKNLEVDFFGGEPTLNFDVVKDTVAYARGLEKNAGKVFKFTMTTNAVALTDADINWLNKTMSNIVLSIDGRKSVHNCMRPDAAGNGSFDSAVKNSLKVRAVRGDKDYYVRGTFTSLNTDFSLDAEALSDCGFDQISLEPVVLEPSSPMALKESDLPALKEQYRRLAALYRARKNTSKAFRFFHFNIDLAGGPCERKRLTGCGAGTEYVAVASNGDLYPCHQFVGDASYLMGSVRDGVTDTAVGESFCDVNIHTKPDCRECWAKYYCSGGCNANAVHFCGDIKKPLPLLCELSRERIECALALKCLET